ncbi:MAG: hypothetical protein ACRCYU_23440 [Nocardioides sp.]
MLHVSGSIDVLDDESGDDEHDVWQLDERINVQADAPTPFHFDKCTGDEVNAVMHLDTSLDRSTGTITMAGRVQYFEQDDCDRGDLEQQKEFTITLERGQTYPFTYPLGDGDGHVHPNLIFSNVDP